VRLVEVFTFTGPVLDCAANALGGLDADEIALAVLVLDLHHAAVLLLDLLAKLGELKHRRDVDQGDVVLENALERDLRDQV
jgi:hypothetical protein